MCLLSLLTALLVMGKCSLLERKAEKGKEGEEEREGQAGWEGGETKTEFKQHSKRACPIKGFFMLKMESILPT